MGAEASMPWPAVTSTGFAPPANLGTSYDTDYTTSTYEHSSTVLPPLQQEQPPLPPPPAPPPPPGLVPEIWLSRPGSPITSSWSWSSDEEENYEENCGGRGGMNDVTHVQTGPRGDTPSPSPPPVMPGFLRLDRGDWRQRRSAIRRSRGGTGPATRHGHTVMATYNGQALTEEPFRNVWEVCYADQGQGPAGHCHHQQRLTNGTGTHHLRPDDDLQSPPSSTGATFNCSL